MTRALRAGSPVTPRATDPSADARTARLLGAVATGAAAAAAAAGTALATRLLHRRPPGGQQVWRRTNHRGEPVTLLEGPALVLGAAAGLLAAPRLPARVRAGAVVAVLGAGGLGAYDDLAGDRRRKGLAGHLGALARGEVTTGAVKLLGLAATGLVAAAATGVPAPGHTSTSTGRAPAGGAAASAARWLVEAAVGGAVVAGSANLLNLLDLRPGRALKTVVVPGVALAAGAPRTVPDATARAAVPAAVVVGSAAVLLPADLGERTMLGDCGANAAGALLGVAALGRLGPRGRAAVLAGLVALTVASERISFTRVIEATPVLRELDRLGRRRVDPAQGR